MNTNQKEISDKIIISQTNHLKILSLLSNTKMELASLLEDELSRATVVPDDQLPNDVVTIDSHVTFQELETGKTSDIILVFPHEAKIEENKISILTPVGAALIGLKVGQSITWPFPNGKQKKLKVIGID